MDKLLGLDVDLKEINVGTTVIHIHDGLRGIALEKGIGDSIIWQTIPGLQRRSTISDELKALNYGLRGCRV